MYHCQFIGRIAAVDPVVRIQRGTGIGVDDSSNVVDRGLVFVGITSTPVVSSTSTGVVATPKG